MDAQPSLRSVPRLCRCQRVIDDARVAQAPGLELRHLEYWGFVLALDRLWDSFAVVVGDGFGCGFGGLLAGLLGAAPLVAAFDVDAG
jgi:hypothetical protein